MRALIVCSENTCRSPMLESMLFAYLTRNKIEGIDLSSAGIMGGDNLISEECEKTLFAHNIPIKDARSTRLDNSLIDNVDVILTMTNEQCEHIKSCFKNANAISLSTLNNGDIVDPYGKGINEYEKLYQTFDNMLENIVNLIKTY